MHMHDIILYGHLEIMKATEKLPLDRWELPNACGVWSVKNIVAHLTAYELMLVDVLSSLLDENTITPTLSNMFSLRDTWNDDEVEKRKHLNDVFSKPLQHTTQNLPHNKHPTKNLHYKVTINCHHDNLRAVQTSITNATNYIKHNKFT